MGFAEMTDFEVDPRFEAYFSGRLRQVFFYITDRCQLRCEQCLYKTTLANRDISEDSAMTFLRLLFGYGARKLTFIGGEPTLYDRKHECAALFRIAQFAKQIGYEYVRLDSNGLFSSNLLEDDGFTAIDNLALSFDGPDQESHEVLRGPNTFHRALATLRQARNLGIYTTVTVCVHPGIVRRLPEVISFFNENGASEINFHPLFKMGIARDEFTGNTDIQIEEWRRAFYDVKEIGLKENWGASVRMPKRFVPKEEYFSNPEMYRYCPTRMGERVLIHPNGHIRVCALCIGTETTIANFDANGVKFNDSTTSEIGPDRLGRGNCLSQVADFGEYMPLCISYKENQKEYVWRGQSFDRKLRGQDGIGEYLDDSHLVSFLESNTKGRSA